MSLWFLSWGLVGVHYLVSIVVATRAPRSAGMAFGCQSLVTIDFLARWGWGGERGTVNLTHHHVLLRQRLRSSCQARTASALLRVEETYELVARAPESSRGACRISLSGLEAGVAAAGALRGGRQRSAGETGSSGELVTVDRPWLFGTSAGWCNLHWPSKERPIT